MGLRFTRGGNVASNKDTRRKITRMKNGFLKVTTEGIIENKIRTQGGIERSVRQCDMRRQGWLYARGRSEGEAITARCDAYR